MYVVICTFRNTGGRIDKCVDSLVAQQDKDLFKVVFVDDASDNDDSTSAELAAKDYGWIYRKNEIRLGPTANQALSIREFVDDPEDVIVWLDGDDALTGPDTFSYLESVYSYPNVWMSYGQYRPVPHEPLCSPAAEYPPATMRSNNYRFIAGFNHLRTMKKFVFDHIPDEYMQLHGDWSPAGADCLMMTSALEICGGRYAFNNRVLVDYTSDNPGSEVNMDISLTQAVHARSKQLKPLPSLAGDVIVARKSVTDYLRVPDAG